MMRPWTEDPVGLRSGRTAGGGLLATGICRRARPRPASASKKGRRLDGSDQPAEIVRGVKFKDGKKPTERVA